MSTAGATEGQLPWHRWDSERAANRKAIGQAGAGAAQRAEAAVACDEGFSIYSAPSKEASCATSSVHTRQGQGTASPIFANSMQSSAALAVSMLLQNSIKAREPAGAQPIKYRLVLELAPPTSYCHIHVLALGTRISIPKTLPHKEVLRTVAAPSLQFGFRAKAKREK
jgi:hypothetical protein